MKKRTISRAVDLLSGLPEASSAVVEFLAGKFGCFITDYNEIMIEYESGRREIRYVFIFTGSHELGVFQHLPLFCKYYNIEIFRVNVRIDSRVEGKVPIVVAVRETDAKYAELKEVIERK